MELIKSVRVRPKNINNKNLDVKVSLYFEDTIYYNVVWESNKKEEFFYNTNSYLMNIKKDFFKKNVSSDDVSIISGFNLNNLSEYDFLLNETILTKKKLDNLDYVIIQDPHSDEAPVYRNYGFDPYYINNGCKIYIKWFDENDNEIGGLEWSNDDGSEKNIIDGYDKSSISKKAIIFPPENSNVGKFILQKNEFALEEGGEYLIYSGTTKDRFIINEIMRIWNLVVPTYITELCEPSNEYCNINTFISPLQKTVVEEKEKTKEESSKKKKLIIEIDKSKIFYVGEDISDILIYEEGKSVNKNNQGFIFSEEEEDLSLLGDEYFEEDFSGLELEEIELSEENKIVYEKEATELFNVETPVDSNVLDLIPGKYVDNNNNKIELCQIDGCLLNIKIAGAFLEMKEAAAKEGIKLKINSGFRSPYDTIDTFSKNGVRVKASSQKYLYDSYKAGKPGFNLAAKPGRSNHGNGLSVDLNTGSKRKGSLNKQIYTWLVSNSWKYGFIRAVKKEEWHFDYLPNLIREKNMGPYSKIENTEENLFFRDLGLDSVF